LLFTAFIPLVLGLSGCGEGASAPSSSATPDSKYSINYKGLSFYDKNLPISNYKLSPLSDSDFNALNDAEKLLVADKLLATLFFAYPLPVLQEKIASGTFISSVAKGLEKETTDKTWLESEIRDESKFYRPNGQQESLDILARFYAAKDLDRYFFHNWVAYILTQTIMFSPAYELDSSHVPNIARVYNRIVTLLEDDASMRYITYVHATSEDNWRRFRSPEDNGREMLEIYTFNGNDADVPLAATALQNWKLDRDYDTLVVGLNENTKPLKLFNTTIYNGDDFYREMVKSTAFTKGVVKRLVQFFFTNDSAAQIESITNAIVASKPETWQDILKQIVFSKEYLLHTSRAKSAEEAFFSLAKKMDFKTNIYTIYHLRYALDNMHQASMKYKLGKLNRVPLDTLSFANYSKYMREEVLLRHSNPAYDNNMTDYRRQGWSDSFTSMDNFTVDYSKGIASLHNYINYIFQATIARSVTQEELGMFDSLMLQEKNGVQEVVYLYNIIDIRLNNDGTRRGDEYKKNVTYTVLDYINRLEDLYEYKKVK
jgi:hypothetical protein